METKELKITIPEDQEIDWQESAKQEKIVLKKKDTKPRSWEEYCSQQIVNKKKGYYIDDANCTSVELTWNECVSPDIWKNVLPSKKLSEAFLAMMQLMSLRQEWIGDWEPDWCNDILKKWCIVSQENKLKIDFFIYNALPLSFPTKEMAEDFMNCFKGLLNIAKPLI